MSEKQIDIDLEALRAQIREEERQKLKDEMESLASTAVTVAQLVEETGASINTINAVIAGANLEPVITAGRSKLYDPKQFKMAYAKKHQKLLNYFGVIHQVEA